MDRAEIHVGRHYAFREKRLAGAPIQQIRILSHARGRKWKAEWINPNPGLVDYVDSNQLVASWKERIAFLRNEESEQRLREHGRKILGDKDSPVSTALSQVFESMGEGLQFWHAILEGDPEAIGRVKDRARMDRGKESPLSYVDNKGMARIACEEAVEIAHAFCASEPSTVLTHIEITEREWSQEVHQPGTKYLGPLLNDYRASWALVRQWAGMDKAVAEREAQVQRLERLVWDAIYALQKAGLDSEASRLRQAVGRRIT